LKILPLALVLWPAFAPGRERPFALDFPAPPFLGAVEVRGELAAFFGMLGAAMLTGVGIPVLGGGAIGEGKAAVEALEEGAAEVLMEGPCGVAALVMTVPPGVVGDPPPLDVPPSADFRRFINEFHRFLTAFSGRPGRSFAISHHLLPILL